MLFKKTQRHNETMGDEGYTQQKNAEGTNSL